MGRLFIALGLVALLALLNYAFPYALEDGDTRMRVLYLSLFLVFGLVGRQAYRNRPVPRMLRDIGIWAALLMVLVLAYSFRDEFGNSRLLGALIPSRVHVHGDGTLSIRASEDGHFYAEGEVNGTRLRFLIDTGASSIVLTPGDAKRAGFNPDMLRYDQFFNTANGGGSGAGVTLDSLDLGSIRLESVPATVNKAWMHESLLGMSFLHRLKSFKVEGDTLVLAP